MPGPGPDFRAQPGRRALLKSAVHLLPVREPRAAPPGETAALLSDGTADGETYLFYMSDAAERGWPGTKQYTKSLQPRSRSSLFTKVLRERHATVQCTRAEVGRPHARRRRVLPARTRRTAAPAPPRLAGGGPARFSLRRSFPSLLFFILFPLSFPFLPFHKIRMHYN